MRYLWRAARAVSLSALLLAASPVFCAQFARAPLRLPGTLGAGAAATISGASVLRAIPQPGATPLQTLILNPDLALRGQRTVPTPAPAAAFAQAPAQDALPGWTRTRSGIYVPAGRAPAETGAVFELEKTLAESQNVPASETISNLYDGGRQAPAAVVEDVAFSPEPITANTRAKKAPGRRTGTERQQGAALLASLHEITGRGFQEHDYEEAWRYMFSVAENIVSHGVRGVVDAYSLIFVPGTSDNGSAYPEKGDQNEDEWVDRDGMNVEHPWPQSFFKRKLPMRSDLHCMLATFIHPNSMRSNLPFGEVRGQSEYSNNGGAKMGQGVFEPPNATKGKVARDILYFFTRYYDKVITQGAYNNDFFSNRLEMFLRWNREHPPDADERRHNDLVERFQGNCNPFIDDPSLADRIGLEGFRSQTVFNMRARNADNRNRSLSIHPLDFLRQHKKHGRLKNLPLKIPKLDFNLN